MPCGGFRQRVKKKKKGALSRNPIGQEGPLLERTKYRRKKKSKRERKKEKAFETCQERKVPRAFLTNFTGTLFRKHKSKIPCSPELWHAK